VTIAKRVAPIILIGPDGTPADPYTRGGMEVPHLEAIARFHEGDGADEIWLRLAHADERGAAALFDPVRAVRSRVSIPIVVWGAVRSSADARLLVGLGADRVIVDEADPNIDDVEAAVADIASAIGTACLGVALITRRRVKDLEKWSSTRAVAWELCRLDGEPRGEDAVARASALTKAGAGEVVLQPWLQGFKAGGATGHDPELVDRLLSMTPHQVVSVGQDHDPADMVPALLMGADGVASWTLFADGQCTVADTKRRLEEFGIPLRPVIAPYAPGA
jgi:imidazole glycerol phosphate synthase subunit HisF